MVREDAKMLGKKKETNSIKKTMPILKFRFVAVRVPFTVRSWRDSSVILAMTKTPGPGTKGLIKLLP